MNYDGYRYPHGVQARAIRNFDIVKRDPFELMEYVKKWWWYPEWGWRETDLTGHPDFFFRHERATRYDISTGGWSGNETLIDALESNIMFYALFWVQSRRGGHYIYEVHTLPR